MPIKLANNASGTLATAISASDTGLVLQAGNGAAFPTLAATDYFYATLVSTGGTQEVVKVTARVGDTMTVVRAQEGSSAADFSAGSRLEMRVTAGSIAGYVQDRIVSVLDFGAVGDGVADDTAAFQAALAAARTVYAPPPPVAYRWATTLSIPNNCSLIGQGGQVAVNGDAAFLLNYSGTLDSTLDGFVITGPNSGTSYQIRFSNNAKRNRISNLAIINGNSGIDVLDSQDNDIAVTFQNMRGSGVKLNGATTTGNIVRSVEAVNVAGFGVLLENNASKNTVLFVSKRLDVAALNSTLAALHSADIALGRIGLEAVGLRIGSDQNSLGVIHAFDCGDNGVSITGASNSIATVVAVNNDNDGLRIYGSQNTVGAVTAVSNAQSGLGIGPGATTGLAYLNSVGAVVARQNSWYGVDLSGVAEANIVVGVAASNTLGDINTTSGTRPNTILINNRFGINVSGSANAPVHFKNDAANSIDNDVASDTGAAALLLSRSRGSQASKTAVVSGSTLGEIIYRGYSGTQFSSSARVRSVVQGTVSGGNVPAALQFFVTRDGASSDEEAVRIWHDGATGFMRPAIDVSYTLGQQALRFSNVYAQNLRPGAGNVFWTSGAGTPEGLITAPVGSLYTRTDGGASTTLYIKESGAGPTGWVAK